MTDATMALEPRTEAVVARDTGLVGKVTVTWTVAGGLLLGGYLVAGMTLAGRLSGNALLLTAGMLYLIGALAGFVHGAALAYFGRPAGMTTRDAFGRLGMAAMYAVPAVTVGFLAAGWIAMTNVALYLDRVLPMAGAAVGWFVGAIIVVMAVRHGWAALRNAYARWTDARLGTVLVAATFAALLVLLLADRPMLFGAQLRVTEVGAVLLAAMGAFWVAGPVVTLGLELLRRVRTPAAPAAPTRLVANVVIGLAAGTMLALVALPVHTAAYATAPALDTVGGAVLLLGRALVDEVLLRLFMVTALVWGALRFWHMPRGQAVTVAVIVAAIAQVMLYLPGALEIGFATAVGTAAYVMAGVLLPALVLGVLFWRRGFATALTAHAAALIALALLT